MNYWPVLFLLFFLLSGEAFPNEKFAGHNSGTKVDAPYLVVLSMDGFRWDYTNLYYTPTLDSIANVGVKAQSMMPSFPSKTFPNHYTMATGLYPEHHGIVLNSFTDPHLGAYSLSKRGAVQNPAFYLGEPIWVTAEKQGLRSACFFWPGSEAPIQGYYPDIWKVYDGSVSYQSRIDSVVAWLQKPAPNRPHLVMWYVDEPDHVGHKYGPESLKTRQTVERLDSLLGVFCRKINQLPCKDSVNLVFTADHGMGAISPDREMNLRSHLNDEWVSETKGGNPVIMIQPTPGNRDKIVAALQRVAHLNVYTRESMPESLHYNESNRIFDVVCVADSAWSIYWDRARFPSGGTHGYDPVNRDMHALFYAVGPAFKQHYQQATFQNINLYALFAEILGLSPAKTDGNLDEVKGMLVE